MSVTAGMLALAASLAIAAGDVPRTTAVGAAPAVTAAAPEATTAFDAVLRRLAARKRGHVTYTETQELHMLKAPLHSSGELLYVAPDYLEKRALQPRAETLIIDGDTLTAQRRGHSWRTTLSQHPQLAPFAASLRATLAGDRAQLEHYFTVHFTGDIPAWTLQLLPLDPALARQVRSIRIQGADDALRSVEIVQADGDRSRLELGAEIVP